MTAPVETPPAGETPETNAAPATPAPPAPSPANMPQTSAAAAPTTEVEAPKEPEESPDLAKLRKENASWRTKLREQEQAAAALKEAQEKQAAEAASLKDVLAKLNQVLNPDANAPADPEKLLEQLSAAEAKTAQVESEYQAKIRDLTIRASLPNVLAAAKADPGLTEAVLTASGALSKLDPSSDTFTDDLASAVAAAMEANPRLKVDTPAVQTRKSGAEIPGRSGGSNQITTREEIEQLAKIPGALAKARAEGRLRSLGAS